MAGIGHRRWFTFLKNSSGVFFVSLKNIVAIFLFLHKNIHFVYSLEVPYPLKI